jgi:hypothetical protein
MTLASALEMDGPSHRDVAIAAAMAGAAALFVMTDCVLYQTTHGGVDAALALKWLAGVVVPWAAAFILLRLRVASVGGRPSWAEAGLLMATLAASIGLDGLLIPPADVAELASRLQSRAPLLAFTPLAARLRLEWTSRPARRTAQADRRFADARLVRAAGNYVEVEGPHGRRLIRMTIAEAEQRMDPADRLRIHRSTLVTLGLIERLERDRNGIVAVRLLDGRRLRVGRSYRAAVRQAVEA